MQTVNNTSKRNPRASKSTQTWSPETLRQLCNTLKESLYRRQDSYHAKEQANFNTKITVFRDMRDCVVEQVAYDARLSIRTTRACNLICATIYKDNPRISAKFSQKQIKTKTFKCCKYVRRQDKRSQTRLRAITGQDHRKRPKANLASPAESPVLL